MLLKARYVLPISADIIVDGGIVVRDGAIADIGPFEVVRLRNPEEEVVDYGTAALMPGLVDVHTHLEYSVMRGLSPDLPYVPWVFEMLRQAAKMDPNDWYDSAILGGLEAISNGITCVGDITVRREMVKAASELGLRAVLYREVGAMDKRRVGYAMNQAERDIADWAELYGSNLLHIGIASAPVFMCHPLVYGKVAAFAREEGLRVAMRLAGSREEVNFVRYGSSPFAVDTLNDRGGYVEVPPWLPTGTSPIRYALNWGAFEADHVLVIHAVYIDEHDLRKMKEYQVAVGVCSRCNAQLGMGVASVGELVRSGLAVGVGTDSPAAVDSTDVFRELAIGMLLQRATHSHEFADAKMMLRLATEGGARALGLEDSIGTLDVGKRADIIAVDLSVAGQTPLLNIESTIVNTCTGNDVLMTMVDGEVLYEKNQWHVDVDVAHNIVRVIGIRNKLRA